MQIPPTSVWSDPAATRTQDLLLRRQLLYPAELRGHHVGAPRFELGVSCSQSRRDNRASLCPGNKKRRLAGRLLAEKGGFEPPVP